MSERLYCQGLLGAVQRRLVSGQISLPPALQKTDGGRIDQQSQTLILVGQGYTVGGLAQSKHENAGSLS